MRISSNRFFSLCAEPTGYEYEGFDPRVAGSAEHCRIRADLFGEDRYLLWIHVLLLTEKVDSCPYIQVKLLLLLNSKGM